MWPQYLVTPCKNFCIGTKSYSPYSCSCTFYNIQHKLLIVQRILWCYTILMTENNSAPFSVEHFRSICEGDTLRNKAHCLFKALHYLVALMCNYILEGAPKKIITESALRDSQSNGAGNTCDRRPIQCSRKSSLGYSLTGSA